MGIAFQLPILVFKRVFSSCAGLRQGLGLLFFSACTFSLLQLGWKEW